MYNMIHTCIRSSHSNYNKFKGSVQWIKRAQYKKSAAALFIFM